ncbi:MAG: hypothetical protein AAB694_01550 [Patescibacteria group bacterium]
MRSFMVELIVWILSIPVGALVLTQLETFIGFTATSFVFVGWIGITMIAVVKISEWLKK